jgi:hypothetical protein
VPGNDPIRLEDLPQFTMDEVADSGATYLGRVTNAERSVEGCSYLLLSDELALPGGFSSDIAHTGRAQFQLNEPANTQLVGMTFPVLDGHWSPWLIRTVASGQERFHKVETGERTEECEICFRDIEPGEQAQQADSRFVCQACYNAFVIPRDLSFILK